MTDLAPNTLPDTAKISPFGQQLRQWRKKSRMSQLVLASAAGTTPRHLSFIETGRSRPGRGLILRLATALDIPLKHQNSLLASAGFSGIYSDHSAGDILDHPLRPTLERILEKHAPYPAAVFGPGGHVLLTNKPFDFVAPGAGDLSPEQHLELFFSTGHLAFANWNDLAWAWITKMRHSVSLSNNPAEAKLLERALTHLGGEPEPPKGGGMSPDVISPIWIINGTRIHTYTTVMRFDAPLEVTLSELKIELVYPADDAADAYFQGLSEK